MQQSAAGSKMGLKEIQLFSPHINSSLHWSSLSQSPSNSSQGSLSVQHDQVSASLVPLQLHFSFVTQQSARSAKFSAFAGCISLQLFSPHRRPLSHSSLLSQSPSFSLHLFSMLQHVHPGLPVDGPVDHAASKVDSLQSHLSSCALTVNDERKWFPLMKKTLIFPN